MQQPGGLGSLVVWVDPADYCETFLGFRRYFTLENAIAKALFDLANRPPQHWKDIGGKLKVVRRDRVQTASGAVQSALFGAAFALQAGNMRAAANHEIQSPGAQITKHVQKKVWDIQPVGIHELLVAPLNVHDELMVPTHPDHIEDVTEAVREGVESFRLKVPLIGMTWNEAQANWAEKKGGSKTVKMKAPAMEAPAMETPATETPATETPATETPATETPATETAV
jgi:DNA polymerase I-like protein with 3'-5' exonuclease and polymerase domains